MGRSIGLVIAVLGAFGPAAAAAQAGQSQSFTVVDRTMVCTIAYEGGVPDRIRTLSVSISRELGQDQGQSAAWFNLGTGRNAALVTVRADATSVGSRPYVLVNRRRCKHVKVPFSQAREERSAAPVEFRAHCKLLDAPRQVVVRLRASMRPPARWSVFNRDYLIARGNALDASVAVRTFLGRKPLAFASLDRTGAARFFAVPGCAE